MRYRTYAMAARVDPPAERLGHRETYRLRDAGVSRARSGYFYPGGRRVSEARLFLNHGPVGIV